MALNDPVVDQMLNHAAEGYPLGRDVTDQHAREIAARDAVINCLRIKLGKIKKKNMRLGCRVVAMSPTDSRFQFKRDRTAVVTGIAEQNEMIENAEAVANGQLPADQDVEGDDESEDELQANFSA